MLNELKFLESINDFPKVGLLYFENSGENLLRFYLENIFKIKTGNNIKNNICSNNLFQETSNFDLNWIISSDFPCRQREDYNPIDINSAILIVRNPIDLIMCKVMRDSYYLEDAMGKIDLYIDLWKEFYKYWFHCPIPIHIVRYEDLIKEPKESLKFICQFLIGTKNLENSKIEFKINNFNFSNVEKYYYAYDVEIKENIENFLSQENADKFKLKFHNKLFKIMKKLNYESDALENTSTLWVSEFNKDSLVKSVEHHEFKSSHFLTSNYFALKIG